MGTGKIRSLIGILSILLLIPALGYAEGIMSPQNIQIQIDNYCDGYSLYMDPSTGIVTGSRTGCESASVYGVLGFIMGGQGLAFTIRDDVYNELKVIRTNGTWTYYKTGGEVFNEGTWTRGVRSNDDNRGVSSSEW